MLEGLHVSAEGGRLQGERLDLVGYNLSQMTSTGYRADYAAVQAAAVEARELARPGRLIISPDFSEGTRTNTGRSLDVALIGDGYLRASDGKRTIYTRAGNLRVDGDKQLALPGGFKVMSSGGASISVSPELDVRIDSEGQVIQEGSAVGQLDLVKFSDPRRQLTRLGNHFVAVDPSAEPEKASCQVASGMRESSNVSSIRAMVELIESSRAFEANMRMIKYQDQTLGKLIAQVGSIPT